MLPGQVIPGLVGREAEVERLNAMASQAAAGRGAAVVLEGEPGIGKTTLLDAVAGECTRLGMRLLRGAASDVEWRLPFATVGACLRLQTDFPDPGVARVAWLLRGEQAFGQSAVAANYEFVVSEAILDLLDRWCTAGPAALVVDDVQWADPCCVFVLHRLGQAIEQQPLLMIIATRPSPQDEPATGLVRGLISCGAHLITLGPLEGPAVATLAETQLAAPAGPGLLDLVTGAGGNPLYITELVAALSREGAIHTEDGLVEVNDRGWVPRSLVETILGRLDFLSSEAREALQMAAVLGNSVEVAELSMVLDTSVAALSRVVAMAMRAGLLAESGQQLVFRHGLIRRALADTVPTPVRTALRQRAGQVLAMLGAPVERVAEHLLVGGVVDRQAGDWLVRCADRLIVRAPDIAVNLLRKALVTVEDEIADTLRFYLVRALLWQGSLTEAEEVARVTLATNTDRSREGELYWLLAQARFRRGRPAEAVAAAEAALASPHVMPGQAGRFHGFTAFCLFFLNQFDACEGAAEKALTADEANQDPEAVGLAYHTRALVRMAEGDLEQALALNDRAMIAFGRGLQPDQQVDPHLVRGHCLTELDRFVDAEQALALALQHNQETGGLFLRTAYMFRARLRFLQGRWDDALAEIQAGLDSGPGQDVLGVEPILRWIAALIAVHRDAYRADAYPTSAPDERMLNAANGYFSRWAHALILEAQGAPRQALNILVEAWEQPGKLSAKVMVYLVCPDLVRLAIAEGEHARAHDVAGAVESLAASRPSRARDATAQLCRGLVDNDPEPLLAAARSFHDAGRPLYEGHAYENAAALLATAGRPVEAREALDKAFTLYTELDATWDIARAEARLREVGVRRGVRGTRKRPRQGWEALTDTENRVAVLVAAGRSNPEIAAQMFLSRRTVQTHVSNILRKLNLHSRIELVATVSRRSA